MKHTYRVYEVGADGSEHLTDKTVELVVPDTLFDGDGRPFFSARTFTSPVLTLYGFDQYVAYYYIHLNSNKDKIIITYHYHEGQKPTWVLKRGR